MDRLLWVLLPLSLLMVVLLLARQAGPEDRGHLEDGEALSAAAAASMYEMKNPGFPMSSKTLSSTSSIAWLSCMQPRE